MHSRSHCHFSLLQCEVPVNGSGRAEIVLHMAKMSWSLARLSRQVNLVPYKVTMSSLSLLFTSSSRTCRQQNNMLFLNRQGLFLHPLFKPKAFYLKIIRICERFIITELLPCLWTKEKTKSLIYPTATCILPLLLCPQAMCLLILAIPKLFLL